MYLSLSLGQNIYLFIILGLEHLLFYYPGVEKSIYPLSFGRNIYLFIILGLEHLRVYYPGVETSTYALSWS